MKTDSFDDAFRRKLLSLPPTSHPDDVDRIHQYVVAHQPPPVGRAGYRLAGYVVGGLLLACSLVYNVIQWHTARQLHTTLYAINRPRRTVPPQAALSTGRIDTVYITRYRDGSLLMPDRRLDKPQSIRYRQAELPAMAASTAQPLVPTDRLLTPAPNPSASARPGVNPSAMLTSQRAEQGAVSPGEASQTRAVDEPAMTLRRTSRGPTPPQSTGKPARGVTRQDAPWRANDSLMGKAAAIHEARVSGPVASASERTQTTLEQPDSTATTGPTLLFSPMDSRLSPQPPPVDWSTRRIGYRSGAASVSTPAPQAPGSQKPASVRTKGLVYFGAGADLTSQEVAGSVRIEWRMRPRWSLQSGIRLAAVEGYHYYTADQFHDWEGGDFRDQYAPSVPQTYDLLNIDQTYAVLQMPVLAAYHHPLGRSWFFRLGVGTDLNLYARNRITYDYKENSHSFEQGLYQATVHVPLLNNVTASAGVEREQKRWLFRVGALVNQQQNPVPHRREALNGGGTIQVLYRLNRY